MDVCGCRQIPLGATLALPDDVARQARPLFDFIAVGGPRIAALIVATFPSLANGAGCLFAGRFVPTQALDTEFCPDNVDNSPSGCALWTEDVIGGGMVIPAMRFRSFNLLVSSTLCKAAVLGA